MVSLCSWKRTRVGSSPQLKRKDSDWELEGRCYRAEPWSPGPIWGTIKSPIHIGCSLNHSGNQTISTTSVVLNSGPQTFLQRALELSQPSKSWVSSTASLNFSFSFFFWLKDLLLLTQLDFGSRQLFLPLVLSSFEVMLTNSTSCYPSFLWSPEVLWVPLPHSLKQF